MTVIVKGLGTDQELRARVLATMATVLGKTRVKPTTATVVFMSEKGSRGGVTIRCAVTVMVPRQAPLRVSQVAVAARWRSTGRSTRWNGCYPERRIAVARSADGRRSTTWPGEHWKHHHEPSSLEQTRPSLGHPQEAGRSAFRGTDAGDHPGPGRLREAGAPRPRHAPRSRDAHTCQVRKNNADALRLSTSTSSTFLRFVSYVIEEYREFMGRRFSIST
jgi:hypothetical protein